MPQEKQEFEVVVARHINGNWRKQGETVLMTPRAASYYLPPLGSGLKPCGFMPSRQDEGEKDAKVVAGEKKASNRKPK